MKPNILISLGLAALSATAPGIFCKEVDKKHEQDAVSFPLPHVSDQTE